MGIVQSKNNLLNGYGTDYKYIAFKSWVINQHFNETK